MAATRIGGLLIAITIATVSGSYSVTQEGDVRLVGGDTGIEGRAQVYHEGEWANICFSAGNQQQFELQEADAFCKKLGYTRGAAMTVDGGRTAQHFGIGTGDVFLTSLDCTENTDDGLLGCADVQWGSSCDNDLGVAGVVCRLPGFIGCYLYSNPGFLEDKTIIADLMTLDKCLEGCELAPQGPFKYAALVQRQEENAIVTDCNCGRSNSVLPSLLENDHDCYEPCPGDDTQTCGAHRRAAVYDLDEARIRDVSTESHHIVWPSLGRDYNYGDNGDLWRVTITGYEYAVLHLLSFDLAAGDYVIFRSTSRNSGTTFSSSNNLDLPYRWVTNTATWFEVETRVSQTSPGDGGFIVYYEFGRHCDASDLGDIVGGSSDNIRGGVYYDRECPEAFCASGYEPSSLAVCQLDGTWEGTAACSLAPTPRRTLFPIRTDAPIPPTVPDTPSTTPARPPLTPPVTMVTQPTPPVTNPQPPVTQPPPQPQTTQPTSVPPIPTDPPTQPPPSAQCVLPVLPPYGEYRGTSGRTSYSESDSITHCCVHNYYESNCVVLTCQSNGRWENEEYLERCEPTACLLPVTNNYGSISGTNGRSIFLYGDEISLCCTSSDYCFVLRCRSDGTWDNGDEVLGCPAPRPRPDGDKGLPVWLIGIIIAAIVIGLLIVVICLCVVYFRPRQRHRHHDDKRVLSREYRKEQPVYAPDPRDGYRYPPSPDPRDGYRYPPSPRSPPRQDDYSFQPHRDSGKNQRFEPSAHPSKDPRDYSIYAQYGAARPPHNVPDYKQPRREPSNRRTERRSERSRPRTEGDEASALGALNSVVQDFETGSGY